MSYAKNMNEEKLTMSTFMKRSIGFLVLFFVLITDAFSQVNFVKSQGSGYYLVTEMGDTLHLRGQTIYYNDLHVALRDASQYSAETADRVFVRQTEEYRVDADFGYFDEPEYIEIRDTVYVEADPDTVFIINTVYEKMIETVDWQHRQSAPDSHYVDIEIVHNADQISTHYAACGYSWQLPGWVTCSQPLGITIHGYKDNRTVTVRDTIPLDDFNDFFLTYRESEMANTLFFEITVPSSQIPSALTDFPVYLDLSQLPTSHGYWTNGKADGGDIRIYRVDGASEIEVPREIVSIDQVAETGEVHFLADSLSDTVDTVFRVYYGDTSLNDYLPTDTFGRNAVWADQVRVHHMDSITNSAGNGDATAEGGVTVGGVTGQVGEATNFDGVDDYFSFSESIIDSVGHISIWFFSTESLIEDKGMIWGRFNNNRVYCVITDSTTIRVQGDSGDSKNFTVPTLQTDTWYKLDVSINIPGEGLRLYLDGVESITGALSTVVNDFYPTNQIGRYSDLSDPKWFWDGYLDEFKLSTSRIFSADFISTEYAVQNDPASFYTISAEQSAGGGTIEVGDNLNMDESEGISVESEVDDSVSLADDPAVGSEFGISDDLSFADSDPEVGSSVTPNDQLSFEDGDPEIQGSLSESDLIGLSESVGIGASVSVNDSASLAELVDVIKEAVKAVSDSLSMSSSISISAQVDVIDSASILEFIDVLEEGFISISDEMVLGESLGVTNHMAVSDAFAVLEDDVVTVTLVIDDSMNISSSISTIKEDLIQVLDSFGISDNVETISGQIDEADNLSLDESEEVPEVEAVVGDEMEVSGSPQIVVSLSVTESVSMIEEFNLIKENLITVLDQMSIDEDISVQALVDVTDIVATTEDELISVLTGEEDQLTMVELVTAFDSDVRIAKITFELKQRSISFTLEQRSVKFELDRLT